MVELDKYIQIIHESLSKDLLKKQYQKDYDNLHFTTGHCYIASEAIYHAFGGKENWSAYAGRDHDNGTHWWLKNKDTGEIVDPTKEQYTSLGLEPPYDKGRPCAFLTREPSQRAQKLIERVNERIIQYEAENSVKTTKRFRP